MFIKRKNVLIFAIISIFLILAVGYFIFIRQKEDDEKIIVKTEAVENSNIEIYDIYQGKFISRQSVNLKSRITGEIMAINVKAGDKVNKGDVLIQIDSRKQSALLDSYKAKQPFLENNLEVAKIQYERYRDLYGKKTVSKQDYENALNAYKKAESDLKENTQLIKDESVELSYFTVKAPFTGTVGHIPVKTGDMVAPEEELLSITQNNPLELNVGVSENRSFDLKKGLEVQILDNNNKFVCSSVIDFISPVVDSGTQTILVKSIFKNQDDILRAEQSVKVKIIYDNTEKITIPITSITKIAGQDFVYKIQTKEAGLIARQTQVKLGELQNGRYIVESGLNLKDRIVVQGAQKLYDEALIEEDADKK